LSGPWNWAGGIAESSRAKCSSRVNVARFHFWLLGMEAYALRRIGELGLVVLRRRDGVAPAMLIS
jgi:hypothetical protein